MGICGDWRRFSAAGSFSGIRVSKTDSCVDLSVESAVVGVSEPEQGMDVWVCVAGKKGEF